MKCLDIRNVCLNIGTSEILKNVSFSIESGSIHALIGDNGVGKTSLLRIILGLTSSYNGEIIAEGFDTVDSFRHCIGNVIDSIIPDTKSTCANYLHKVCYMFGTDNNSFEKELLLKVGLDYSDKKTIGKYSLGMKRRLMIACALASKPRFLVLDEPFNGIDPKGMNEMRFLLQQLKSENVTILITSHIISELLKIADNYSIMFNGSVVDTLSSFELSNSKMTKVVIKPEDISKSVNEFREKYPELFFAVSSDETLSVYNITIEKLQENRNIKNLKLVEQKYMSEEDILLWKMSGVQTKEFS